MRATHKRFRHKVQNTQVFQSLNKVQKDMISTTQNLTAIGKSLAVVEKNGVKHWEQHSQNNQNNAEIIRELYMNQLEVKL